MYYLVRDPLGEKGIDMHIWGKPLPRDLLAEGPMFPARNGAFSGHWTHRRSAVVPVQGAGLFESHDAGDAATLAPCQWLSFACGMATASIRNGDSEGFHQSTHSRGRGKLGKVSFGVKFTFLLGLPRRASVLRCCIDQRK